MWVIPQAICGVVISLGQKRERHRIVVGRLHFEARPVDGAAVEPRRRAGLQPPELQAQRVEPLGKLERRGFADPAGRDFLLAHMDEAVEERAGRQNHGARPRSRAPIAAIRPTTRPSSTSRSSTPPSMTSRFGGRRDRGLHGLAIELAVGLGAGAVHGRALGAVEQAELDAGRVGDPAHQAVERIDLADQMALAEPADGRIARHFADRREGVRDQRRARADARRGGGRLGAGMPAANDDDVIHFLRRRH